MARYPSHIYRALEVPRHAIVEVLHGRKNGEPRLQRATIIAEKRNPSALGSFAVVYPDGRISFHYEASIFFEDSELQNRNVGTKSGGEGKVAGERRVGGRQTEYAVELTDGRIESFYLQELIVLS